MKESSKKIMFFREQDIAESLVSKFFEPALEHMTAKKSLRF
jgi:hypothetical protein